MRRFWFVPIAMLSVGLLLAMPAVKCEAKEVGPAPKNTAVIQSAATPLPATAIEACYGSQVQHPAQFAAIQHEASPAPDIAPTAAVKVTLKKFTASKFGRVVAWYPLLT